MVFYLVKNDKIKLRLFFVKQEYAEQINHIVSLRFPETIIKRIETSDDRDINDILNEISERNPAVD